MIIIKKLLKVALNTINQTIIITGTDKIVFSFIICCCCYSL